MTHENVPDGEHDNGPEHDHTLPNAWEIPTHDTVEESDLPALDGDLEV